MNKGKRWGLPLLAALLTAAGAAGPYMTSAMQDARVEGASEIWAVDPVNLTLNSGAVQETLRLLAGSTSELEWSGNTNLTPEEAGSAAKETLRLLEESGLVTLVPDSILAPDAGGYVPVYTEPRLVMSRDESNLSAVVWTCWIESMPGNWIFIDDETGKMVQTFLFAADPGQTLNKAVIGWTQDPEQTFKTAEQWRVFLSEYYGMEMLLGESVREEWEDWEDWYSSLFTLSFDAGTARLTLLGNGDVYFNS
jgi:hypothetical protein